VDPNEIADFCEKTGYKICLDTSHSMMACNNFGWDFSDFLEKVLPHTIHLHIVDARGIDGEGIQIGTGDINFKKLKDVLSRMAPLTPFIPEVWQGHKNSGEGFWGALDYLEELDF
jgi:N-acetylneuraminate synthase